MSWLKSFNVAPEGYVCREFRKEDGILEGVEIDHPIIGGTMEKDGIPVAYAGINLIAGKHWVFMFIPDMWAVANAGGKYPYVVCHKDGSFVGKTHPSGRQVYKRYKHFASAFAEAERLNLQGSVRKHGLWIARLIHDSIKMCSNAGITELYGLCDTTKPKAANFLRTLGFKPLSVYDKSIDVMVYEKLMGGREKAWRRIEGEK